MAGFYDDLADTVFPSRPHADGKPQPFPTGPQGEVADRGFGGSETMNLAAAFQHEALEIPEAVEDHFRHLAGVAANIAVRMIPSGDSGIIQARRNLRWIDAQPFHLPGQLTDVSLEHRMPTVGCGDRLEDVSQCRKVADESAQQWLTSAHDCRHPECAQHLALREAVVLSCQPAVLFLPALRTGPQP